MDKAKKFVKLFVQEENQNFLIMNNVTKLWRIRKLISKQTFFYRILDQTLSPLNNRFEELKTFDDVFGFFSNLFSFSEEELLKHCKDLHLKLKDDFRGENVEADIDGIDLFNELKALKLYFLQNPLHEPYNIPPYNIPVVSF